MNGGSSRRLENFHSVGIKHTIIHIINIIMWYEEKMSRWMWYMENRVVLKVVENRVSNERIMGETRRLKTSIMWVWSISFYVFICYVFLMFVMKISHEKTMNEHMMGNNRRLEIVYSVGMKHMIIPTNKYNQVWRKNKLLKMIDGKACNFKSSCKLEIWMSV